LTGGDGMRRAVSKEEWVAIENFLFGQSASAEERERSGGFNVEKLKTTHIINSACMCEC
jgi:hypothetical protein